MEEIIQPRHFFDPPLFLDGIHPTVLGFGGPVLFLILFMAINRAKLSLGILILVLLLLYFFSVITGAALQSTIGNRPSSFVAAFWAPMVYCSMATVLVRVFHKPPEKGSSGYDHLIH